MENGFICLIGFNNLGYDPDGKLRCKPKFLPDIPINDLLEKNLVVEFLLKGYARDKVAGCIEFDK